MLSQLEWSVAVSVWEIPRISGRSKAAPSLKMAMRSRRAETRAELVSAGSTLPATALLPAEPWGFSDRTPGLLD